MAQPQRHRPVTYLENLGIALDMFFNALFGGVAGQTISMRAALAQKNSQIACWFCQFLSWLIQRNHCADQLDGVMMQPENYFRAGCGLLVLMSLLIGPIVFAWKNL
jgi:hypothetical protein